MPYGEAPIAESSTVDALLARHWSHRRPVPTSVLAVLTVVFWAVWLYLVLPLVSLLLWAFGVRFFIEQIRQGGYEGLRASLLAYSSVLLVLVGLLALWIAWNVVRYGGRSDRRTVKRADVPDTAVREAFRLDDGLLSVLRDERLVHVALKDDGSVMVIVSVSIDAIYKKMRALIDNHAEEPDLREKLRPLREQLRALQANEAQEIIESYATQLRPGHERTPKLKEISASIDAIYDKIQALIESHSGDPGLREELHSLREELRTLQTREAEEITERYDAHLRPKYEKALELISRARQVRDHATGVGEHSTGKRTTRNHRGLKQ